jgi:formylglycine-generating enzyme required for sulfatase activity
MSHDIFVSHSSKDKTVADAACACLESRGLRCWIAPRDIVTGADWSESIIDGINGAKAMVLILTSHANVSKQVLREIERAANRGIPVLPFRVEDVVLSKSLEYFLSSAHWLDAYHGPLKRNLEKLANSAAVVVEKQHAMRPLEDVPAKRDGWTSPLAIAAAIGVVVAMVVAGGLLAWRSSRTVAPEVAVAPTAGASTPQGISVRAGIGCQDLLPPVAKKLGVPNGGVGVTGVADWQRCGIQAGDVVVRFKDKPIASCDDLIEAGWKELSTDEDYPITVVRDGGSLSFAFRPAARANPDSDPNGHTVFGETRRLTTGNGTRVLQRLAANQECVVAVDSDKKAFAWRANDESDAPIPIVSRAFSAVAIAPPGPILFSDARTGELVTWDMASKQVVDVFEGAGEKELVDLLITDDGKTAVAVDEDGIVRIWDLGTKALKKSFSLSEKAGAHGVVWLGLHAGEFTLTGNGRHLGQQAATKFVVWDLDEEDVAAVVDSERRVTAGTISPDSRLAAIGLENGTIEVWDVPENKRIATLRWHTHEVSAVVFLSSNHLVSLCEASSEGTALVWDLRDSSVAWGYQDTETNGVFAFGPQRVAFNRESGALLLASVSVRSVALPANIADELRSFAWNADTLRAIAKPADKPQSSHASTSTVTATFANGNSREISEFADGSSMVTEKDASGTITGMEFQPGPELVGLGIRMGLPGDDPDAAEGNGKVQDAIRVEEVIAGGQAARDGVLKMGDVITAVIEREGAEPTPIAGLYLAEVRRLLLGREGTTVGLVVRRDGAPEPIEVASTRGRTRPVRNTAAEAAFANSIGMEFVAVPAGVGSLGITGDDASSAPHYVRISKAFLIGAHEVTQDEFATVMGGRPSSFSQNGAKAKAVADAYAKGVIPNPDTSHHPVESVSWEDATDFCRRLGEKEGRVYRLPTEAEWEWACRNAGAVEWKNGLLSGSWIDETAVGTHLDFPGTTHPVGSRSPADSGLYDMLGNVAEWCSDRFADDGFSNAAFVDPQGPSKGLKRVVRGGSFEDFGFKFFERSGLAPTDKRHYVGFRVVLEPAEGLLADRNTEKALLDTTQWAVGETQIPDPIPSLATDRRTPEEELQEAKEFVEQINSGSDLRALKDRMVSVAPMNQTQFRELRAPWAELNMGLGNQTPLLAMMEYNRAHQMTRLSSRITLLETARQIEPMLGWVANDMAWILATDQNPAHRDPAIAVQRAVEACQQVRWQYWGFLDTLAAALAADGRFETAVRVAEAALARAPDEERAQVEFAIDRYKQGLAWAPLVP